MCLEKIFLTLIFFRKNLKNPSKNKIYYYPKDLWVLTCALIYINMIKEVMFQAKYMKLVNINKNNFY